VHPGHVAGRPFELGLGDLLRVEQPLGFRGGDGGRRRRRRGQGGVKEQAEDR
jgi:hypothetical protein